MTRKITRTSMLWASCVGILIGAAALLWSPMAEAQGTFSPVSLVQPPQPAKIDRSLPGSRKGMLTKATGAILGIDRASYTLAAGALVEDKFGFPLPPHVYQADGVEYDVQYWLGTVSADRQITQLIITFPE